MGQREGRDWEAITKKVQKRYEDEEVYSTRLGIELESTYAHLRAVIENCKTATPEAIRHQLVGLLPECQEMEPELVERMRAADMGHLVDRHKAIVQQNWAEFGYGASA